MVIENLDAEENKHAEEGGKKPPISHEKAAQHDEDMRGSPVENDLTSLHNDIVRQSEFQKDYAAFEKDINALSEHAQRTYAEIKREIDATAGTSELSPEGDIDENDVMEEQKRRVQKVAKETPGVVSLYGEQEELYEEIYREVAYNKAKAANNVLSYANRLAVESDNHSSQGKAESERSHIEQTVQYRLGKGAQRLLKKDQMAPNT